MDRTNGLGNKPVRIPTYALLVTQRYG